ncbi:hypothetical protein CW306_03930 [Bacillus sp. BA3]|nr:hypothetical protein CW306_03930 [Bacillus sp. BA3]
MLTSKKFLTNNRGCIFYILKFNNFQILILKMGFNRKKAVSLLDYFTSKRPVHQDLSFLRPNKTA